MQAGNNPVAHKPCNLDPLAEKVLDHLTGRSEASEIVLGGYFALQHYIDYRRTHDIDAWWRVGPTTATQRGIAQAMQKVAEATGHELRERRFGETISWELYREGKKRFTFQIAVRSMELEVPIPSAWPPILLETIADNVGAKMNALVERGAARDFLDIAHLTAAKFTSPGECWALWARKNPGGSVDGAKSRVAFHLVTLDSRRPLSSIQDPQERVKAQRTREWFRWEFLGVGA